jgi:chromosome segregation ATPase
MSIDWAKVTKKPEASYKVTGTFLLELKQKIADLEKQVASLTGKNEGLSESMSRAITEKDEQMKAQIEERDSLRDQIASKDGEINALKDQLSASEERVQGLEVSSMEIQGQCQDLQAKVDELEDKVLSQDYDFFKKTIKDKSAQAASTYTKK